MPILKYSEDLNGLNQAKKQVNKHLRRNFKGREVAVDGGTSKNTAETFEILVKKLTDIFASLTELVTTSGLTILPSVTDKRKKKETGASVIADRFVGASSNLIKQSTDIINFTNRVLRNNLNQFSTGQFQEIVQLFHFIENASGSLEDIMEQIDNAEHLEETAQALGELESNWKDDFNAWEKRFGDLIEGYNAGIGANPHATPDEVDDDEGSVSTGAGFRTGMGADAYTPRRYM
jgi:hypothetical protein